MKIGQNKWRKAVSLPQVNFGVLKTGAVLSLSALGLMLGSTVVSAQVTPGGRTAGQYGCVKAGQICQVNPEGKIRVSTTLEGNFLQILAQEANSGSFGRSSVLEMGVVAGRLGEIVPENYFQRIAGGLTVIGGVHLASFNQQLTAQELYTATSSDLGGSAVVTQSLESQLAAGDYSFSYVIGTNGAASSGGASNTSGGSCWFNGVPVVGNVTGLFCTAGDITTFLQSMVYALLNPNQAVTDVLEFLGQIFALPLSIGMLLASLVSNQFLRTIYTGVLPYGIAIVGIGVVIRFIRMAMQDMHQGIVDTLLRAVIGVSMMIVGANAMLWAVGLFNNVALDIFNGIVASVAKKETLAQLWLAHMGPGVVVGSWLEPLVLLCLLLVFMWVFLLLLLRAGMLVLLIGMAPLFIALAIYNANNRFAQWYFGLFIANLIMPIIAAIGLSLTWNVLLTGGQTTLLGSSLFAGIMGPLLALVVLYATGKVMKEIAMGALGAGMGLGGMMAMGMEAAGLALGVATGGLTAGAAIAHGLARTGAGTQQLMGALGGTAAGAAAGAAAGEAVGNSPADSMANLSDLTGETMMRPAAYAAPPGPMSPQLASYIDGFGASGLGGAANFAPAATIAADPQASSLVESATSHLPATMTTEDRLQYMVSNPEHYKEFTHNLMNSGTYTADVQAGVSPEAARFNFNRDEFTALQQQAGEISSRLGGGS